MKSGDCIIWNGWGHNIIEFFYCCGIKLVTGPPVHISTVVEGSIGDKKQLFLWESMWNGQVLDSLDRRILRAKKERWQWAYWLPLKDELREQFNYDSFYDYVISKTGVGYDSWQGLLSPLRINKPNDDKLFCSESHIFALQAAGLLKDKNPSNMTPVDVRKLDIHKPEVRVV